MLLVIVLTAQADRKKPQRVTLHCGMKSLRQKNNAALGIEGGINPGGLFPPRLFVPNRRQRLSPAAPLRLLADNILILVCFLDPGQRSYAAFAKRGSLWRGRL